jgi:hypothetical protein
VEREADLGEVFMVENVEDFKAIHTRCQDKPNVLLRRRSVSDNLSS